MAIGTTPCSLNDNTLVQFIYARALSEGEQTNRIAPIFDRPAGILVDKFIDCRSLMVDCRSRILVIDTHNQIGRKLFGARQE